MSRCFFIRFLFYVCVLEQCLVLVQSSCDRSQLCQWTSWHDWSTCNATCGSGKQFRWRGSCCEDNNNLDFFGCLKYCNLSTTQYLEHQTCSNFTSCSVPRTKTNPLTEQCLVLVQSSCDRSHLCQWTSWHDWSTCNATCGSGKQFRWRGSCCEDNSLDFYGCVRYCNLSTTQYLEHQTCSNFTSCSVPRTNTDPLSADVRGAMGKPYLPVMLCLLSMAFMCFYQVQGLSRFCEHNHQNFTECDVMFYTNWKICTGGHGLRPTACTVGYEKRLKAICCPMQSKNEAIAQTTANCKANCNLTDDDFEEIRPLTTTESEILIYAGKL